jgi:hypothetical protein
MVERGFSMDSDQGDSARYIERKVQDSSLCVQGYRIVVICFSPHLEAFKMCNVQYGATGWMSVCYRL